jgi:multiple sugar transport system substrate-binding protein
VLSRALAAILLLAACGVDPDDGRTVVTFPGSALGEEGRLLQRQIVRFMEENPDIRVDLQRTPDDATQRHQLYVQRLNARSHDPDILQLDVIWTPEFAAAGWLLPLDEAAVDTDEFFPATLEANRWWDGQLFAVPWFVDVGMLYWRTDLLPAAPATMDALTRGARAGMSDSVPRGIVWQGARYEGLVTTFLEYLGGFGGEIMTSDGRVVVDSPQAIRALTFMHAQIHNLGIAPEAVLTWHEEEARFAFQNGTAVMMRNWPYAYALLASDDSRVAGRFSVAPMPAAPGGHPTAALGGNQLAINARSDAPEAALRLIAFLTATDQMLERAELAGQFPTRHALYDDPRLAASLPMPADQARAIIEAATPRPVIPIWTELSEILQIELHRALVGQASPEVALGRAARAMTEVVDEAGIPELQERMRRRGVALR